MICEKCEKETTEQTVFIWKCNSCGKAFKTNDTILKKLVARKNSNSISLVKCKNCGNYLDDEKEQIFWKCECEKINKFQLEMLNGKMDTKNIVNQSPQINNETKNDINIHSSDDISDNTQSNNQLVGCFVAILMWVLLIFGFYAFYKLAVAGHPFLGILAVVIFSLLSVASLKLDTKENQEMTWSMYEERQNKREQRNTNGYKCPNCGANAGHTIGAISKGVSVGTFGLASNKIGKSYKCAKCGYMW